MRRFTALSGGVGAGGGRAQGAASVTSGGTVVYVRRTWKRLEVKVSSVNCENLSKCVGRRVEQRANLSRAALRLWWFAFQGKGGIWVREENKLH